MTILWVLIIVFGMMSIVFLLGKGSFLIAGYNTSSKQQKDMYDEKKMCRVMGMGTLIITFSLVASIFFEEYSTVLLIGGILLSTVFMFIGTNLFCKKKGYQENKNTDTTVWYKNKNIWHGAVTGIILVVVAFMMFTGTVSVDFYDDHFNVGASLTTGTDVYYKDIESVEYAKDISLGSREFGVGSARLQAGHFKNDAYGSYNLYSYSGCEEYVVIKTKETYVVINAEDEKKTQALYKELQSRFNAVQ